MLLVLLDTWLLCKLPGCIDFATAACPPADSEASKSALAANSSPEAWHPDSRGISLSPSPAALARLRPNLSSGLARVGIQVDSFPVTHKKKKKNSTHLPITYGVKERMHLHPRPKAFSIGHKGGQWNG